MIRAVLLASATETRRARRRASSALTHCGVLAPGVSHDRGCADDEEGAHISVAHLRDRAETFLAAARVLSWHEPEPGCELPAGCEVRGIGHRGGDGRRRDEANAWDRLQPSAGVGCPMPGKKLDFDSLDLCLKLPQLRHQRSQRTPCQGRASSSVPLPSKTLSMSSARFLAPCAATKPNSAR